MGPPLGDCIRRPVAAGREIPSPEARRTAFAAALLREGRDSAWQFCPRATNRADLPASRSVCFPAAVGTTSRPPKSIQPQLTRLVAEAPPGDGWLPEIKYDGYRMHARIDDGQARLLTRTGLDWSHRHGRTIEALARLPVRSAYLDGELCALDAAGVPVFSRLQAAMDEGRTGDLVFFAFDLLHLDGTSTAQLPLSERKARLQRLFNRKKKLAGLRYSEHVVGEGPAFRAQACKLGLEGAISKQVDRP